MDQVPDAATADSRGTSIHRECLFTARHVLAGLPELLSYFALGGIEEAWARVKR